MVSNRYAVPLLELEGETRLARETLMEGQAEVRPAQQLQAGPHLHPFADGATSDDGD